MLSEKQMKMRQTGIGASECAVAAGYHPFISAWDLYNAKVHGSTQPENNAMRAGNFLEDGVAKMYLAARGDGIRLRKSMTRRHQRNRWMLATIDREVIGESGKREGILEIKVPGSRSFYNQKTGEREIQWGDGPDDIPPYIACQAQWQMEVVGIDTCDVAAFFLDRREIAIYRQVRDAKFIESLVAINEKFWRDHVLAMNPPQMDGSSGADEYLKGKYPTGAGGIVVAPPSALDAAIGYAKARDDEAEAVERKKFHGNQLRQIIGSNEGIAGNWGKATWMSDAKGKIDYKSLCEELNPTLEALERHRGQPSRVLRVTCNLNTQGEDQ